MEPMSTARPGLPGALAVPKASPGVRSAARCMRSASCSSAMPVVMPTVTSGAYGRRVGTDAGSK